MRKDNPKHNKIIKKIVKLRNEISEAYDEINILENKLLDSKFKSNSIAYMRDNFKDKNVVYRTTSIRRFELIIK